MFGKKSGYTSIGTSNETTVSSVYTSVRDTVKDGVTTAQSVVHTAAKHHAKKNSTHTNREQTFWGEKRPTISSDNNNSKPHVLESVNKSFLAGYNGFKKEFGLNYDEKALGYKKVPCMTKYGTFRLFDKSFAPEQADEMLNAQQEYLSRTQAPTITK